MLSLPENVYMSGVCCTIVPLNARLCSDRVCHTVCRVSGTIRSVRVPSIPETFQKELHPQINSKMSNRVLYWFSGSAPAWRARAVLAEKGLSFESKRLDPCTGTVQKPGMRNDVLERS